MTQKPCQEKNMNTRISKLMGLASLLACGNATAIDTSEPFLCAVSQVYECLDGAGCEAVLPEMVSAPTFIWVDEDKKQIRTNQNRDGTKATNIESLDGRHILQGAEDGNPNEVDGAAWSLSIEDATGRFVGAIAVQQASISLFGACTELD